MPLHTPPFLQRLKLRALDALAPCHCAACGLRSYRPVELCEACENELPWLGPACYQCALPLPGDGALCGQCLRAPPAFDATVAACLFAQPVAGFIHALKYGGQFALLPVLGEVLAQAVADHLAEADTPDLLVPMPLHWARRWRRGFNQADLLAQGLRRHPELLEYELTVNDKLCRRVRATPPQRGLHRDERRRNLRSAMRCGADLAGQSVAIVDDVLTTGASADALANTLKKAGAGRVEVWCCARTPPARGSPGAGGASLG
jgi:ComF family protein